MNRKRKKGLRIRTSYIWAGIMSVCALVALFAAVWVVITVYEKIVGDSAQWAAESSAEETSELEIAADPVSGWITEDGGTRYLDSEGNYLSDQWIVSGEKLYYLDADGYMAVNDVSMDGQIFSFSEEGELTDIQLDPGWVGLTGDDNLQNLDSLVKSNEFWCYLDSGVADEGIFKTIYYRKTTETEANPLGGADNPEKSTHNSLQIHDGYIYYLPQVTSQTLSSLSSEEQKLCNRLYRMKPGASEKELLAENATGFLVLDDGSIYYASDGRIEKADGANVYSVGEEQYRVQVKDDGCYLVDAAGEPVSGDSSGNQVVGDRLYLLNLDGKITGVYPADRTYGQAAFTLEQNSSGTAALYRQESGGTKEMIAQSDYGINSFCIADGMIYYSAYIRRDSDGTRYSAVFQISPEGSGNRQISQAFQGNMLNLYYYPEKGKIYGEYTPVSWRNCYGQIAVIDLDGTVSVIDDSASRGSGVMENNDLLTLVMVDGNTITTYLRSCSYSRTSGSWTVLSEKPYQFSDTLQQIVAAPADGSLNEDEGMTEENEDESEDASAEESMAPSSAAETDASAGIHPSDAAGTGAGSGGSQTGTQSGNNGSSGQRPSQTAPPPSTQPAVTEAAPTQPSPTQPAAPTETEGVISGGPGYEMENSGPGGESIPIIEANPESGNPSGQVEFIGPGYQ